MQEAKTLKGYRHEVGKALANNFLRQAMDNFAVAYRDSRAKAFSEMDLTQLVADVAAAKDHALTDLDRLFARFKERAEAMGIRVHLASDADAANRIIADIARANQVRTIIKSKSMTAEETLLNHHLEKEGLTVTETDLGEWIIQLRHEGPSHMVMPAIHLSRHQVADLFTRVTGKEQDAEIQRLVKVARRELRKTFAQADMGISGANFAIADTATIGLVTNEGNARLVTTLPRVHVALVGLEKLVPTLADALTILKVLPRNATGQAITSYVTWITGPAEFGRDPQHEAKQMHIVFLDNGRRALARDPVFSQVLRCVRCGACANVCPVYRMVGGHQYGHIYIGAIGLIATYFFHGREKARNLVQNCINCGACRAVCAAGIDLPGLIKQVHARIQDQEGHPIQSVMLSLVLKNRGLFHRLLRSAAVAQKPITGHTPYLRHLPHIFSKAHNFRALPAIAEHPFRDQWQAIKTVPTHARCRVALFAGCVQDFVYPEHLIAGARLLAAVGAAVEFPMDQSCCGLPVAMMGEQKAAVEVARQNVAAIDPDRYDHIVTLCASCASHLRNGYPHMLGDDSQLGARVRTFAAKVQPLSVLLNDLLGMDAHLFRQSARLPALTYHAPCHLCRGLDVHVAPKELIRKAGHPFYPASEEETCCGFGGTYSAKFPEISAEILSKKLADAQRTGAQILVTECPGCVLQLRGGAQKRGLALEVKHIAEVLAADLA
jgi:iron-sulfur cluster protein